MFNPMLTCTKHILIMILILIAKLMKVQILKIWLAQEALRQFLRLRLHTGNTYSNFKFSNSMPVNGRSDAFNEFSGGGDAQPVSLNTYIAM